MKEAVEALWAALSLRGSVTVRFVIEGVTSANVTAVPGRTRVDSEFAESATQSLPTRDYIVPLSSLPSGAVPSRGSKVEEMESDGTTVAATYRIEAAGEDRHWSPVDQYGELVRIHTAEL